MAIQLSHFPLPLSLLSALLRLTHAVLGLLPLFSGGSAGRRAWGSSRRSVQSASSSGRGLLPVVWSARPDLCSQIWLVGLLTIVVVLLRSELMVVCRGHAPLNKVGILIRASSLFVEVAEHPPAGRGDEERSWSGFCGVLGVPGRRHRLCGATALSFSLWWQGEKRRELSLLRIWRRRVFSRCCDVRFIGWDASSPSSSSSHVSSLPWQLR
jgi:hypothetical protein